MVRDIASKRLAAAGKTIKKACVKSITFHLKQGSILGVEKAVSILTTTNAYLLAFAYLKSLNRSR